MFPTLSAYRGQWLVKILFAQKSLNLHGPKDQCQFDHVFSLPN